MAVFKGNRAAARGPNKVKGYFFMKGEEAGASSPFNQTADICCFDKRFALQRASTLAKAYLEIIEREHIAAISFSPNKSFI